VKRKQALDQSSAAASQLRLALGIPTVPTAKSSCKQVKHMERLIRSET